MPEDLLERDEVQRQIGRADAITKVTRGVVHNFNNFLAVLLGRVELMLGQVDSGRLDPVPLRRGLVSMQQVVKEAAELLKRLRDLTQPPPLDPPTVVDLNAVARAAAEFVQPHLAARARTTGVAVVIAPRLTAEPVTVSGHPSTLREALVSLLLNAIEAMPRGGEVAVETLRDGGRVLVRVVDAGVGMSEEVLERAFTPFFTTKGPASPGLGLSTVKDVASRHGGTVAVDSRVGVGSAFTLNLPFAAGLEVLLVEDEPDLRDMLDEFLSACGCHVTLAGDGAAAIEELGRGRFDLVLTDLQLPGAAGEDVARAAKGVSPPALVILMSGGLAPDDVSVIEGPVVDAALPKPVDLGRLSRAIGDVVARSRTAAI
jgi:CheY-like chemotaxis protein